MTDYNGLIQSVYVETGRPDLVAETAAAVIQAVVGLHARGRYLKDIKRARVTFDFCSFIQELETIGLPFYRNIAYAKVGVVQNLTNNGVYPPPTGPVIPPLYDWPWAPCALPEFTVIEADDIINVNGYERVNVIYQAGKSLYFKCERPFQFCQFGWYAFPNTSVANNAAQFDSWIADQYPYSVTLAAAANVYGKIGQNDLAAVINNAPPNNPAGIQFWYDIIDRNNIAA